MTPTKRTTDATTEEPTEGFSVEERAAMKEHAKELKAARGRAGRADKAEEEERAVLEKIAEMSDADRALAEQVHAMVKANAPSVGVKLWYGQPAYTRDGKVVCFFQPADKFKTRYSTFGFSDEARLDQGTTWPTSFAITSLTKEDEDRLGELVRRAVG